MGELVFLKLGGSLITDKDRPYTPRLEHIRRLASEVEKALAEQPDLRLLLGHGSGSFGHQAAAWFATQLGVSSPPQWRAFAEVIAAAARLNRLVTDALLDAGVAVVSLQPSASARCRDGLLVHLETEPIRLALAQGLIPMVYGDGVSDEVKGGTIVSTEALFVFLAKRLCPQRILLAGEAPGVLDRAGQVIQRISPADFPAIRPLLGGSRSVDVTGGMADKVARMVELVAGMPGLVVHILSGLEPDQVYRALLDPGLCTGTRIAQS